MSKSALVFIVFAALGAAVPSKAAFFPMKAASDLAEDDITGFGFEPDSDARSIAAAERDESPAARVARQWREMAKRARRQAELLSEPQRQQLIDRAAEYEARAERLEQGGKPV